MSPGKLPVMTFGFHCGDEEDEKLLSPLLRSIGTEIEFRGRDCRQGQMQDEIGAGLVYVPDLDSFGAVMLP